MNYLQRTGRTRSDGRGGVEYEYVDSHGDRSWRPDVPAGICFSGLVAQTVETQVA